LLCSRSFAFQKLRRIAFGRVGHQLDENVQQFGDPGTVTRRDEADRDQVPVAQGFFKWGMQLLGPDALPRPTKNPILPQD
jgi:hypothetical protein